MPDERIFNGDIGTIVSIDKKEILIDYDTNEVRFTPSTYSNFKLGYAISIHKSQGSEFDVTILPISNSYGKMLYKKLYYTAITRAKKKLIIIGDVNALKFASNNNLSDIRKTTIKDRIINNFNEKEEIFY
jgi:exodeoxyribonuclease V alpha subunit